ncbi:MAG: AraC family ligand binding domain-containing protein, partial [Clostridiales bacterium]|nr:AraC family ligand binding domain-containing protein [Clostridiales bacterium]
MDYNFAHGAFDCLCVNNGKHSPNNKYERKIDNNTYLICYVTGGKGRIITDEKEIELKRGYSFLIYPFFEARIEEDTKNPLEYSWVEFKGLEAAWIITQTMFTRKNPVLKKMPVKSFAEHFNVICGENKSAYEQCRTNAKLLLLLSFYLEYFPQKPVKKNQYVGAAREYIDNN